MNAVKRELAGADRRVAAPRPEEPQAAAKPTAYLRAVYPLNPGIPHFIDFPEGWR